MRKKNWAIFVGLLVTLGIVILLAGLSCNTASVPEIPAEILDLTDDIGTIPEDPPPEEPPGEIPEDPPPVFAQGAVLYVSKDGSGKLSFEENIRSWMSEYGSTTGNHYLIDYYNLMLFNKAYHHQHLSDITKSDFKALMEQMKTYNIIFIMLADPGDKDVLFSGNNNMHVSSKLYYEYRLKYLTLKKLLNKYENHTFVIWTGLSNFNRESMGNRYYADELYLWLINSWDIPDDNIYIWDTDFPYSVDKKGSISLEEAIDAICHRMVTILEIVF